MTEDQLERIVLVCIDDLITQEMPDSQVQLIVRFLDNLRQNVADAEQSENFINELQKRLEKLN